MFNFIPTIETTTMHSINKNKSHDHSDHQIEMGLVSNESCVFKTTEFAFKMFYKSQLCIILGHECKMYLS